MSRKQRRAIAQRQAEYAAWAGSARDQAHHDARLLAVGLLADQPPEVVTYGMGIALWEGETLHHVCPVEYRHLATFTRTVTDVPAGQWGGRAHSHDVSERSWVNDGSMSWGFSSHRLITRLPSGDVRTIAYEHIAGVTLDLATEWVVLDLYSEAGGGRVAFTGPTCAPFAVAVIAKRLGVRALVDHPGLAVLRVPPPAPRVPVAVIENTAECGAAGDWLRSL